MQPALYVSLSAQISQERRLETIANNVANSSTVGFRAETMKFESLLSRTANQPVAFASTGETYISRRSGEVFKTDNPLDIAIDGESWLAIETPAGTVYTRDGRMKMEPGGALQTLNGYAVLDAGGAPIELNANGGPPLIARDGMITQSGRQVAAIGLFTINENARLTRFENSGVIPDQEAEPALDFGRNGVLQGYLEGSNVNPIQEITRLIMIQRAFDAITASLNDTEKTLQGAIQSLGSGT